MRVVFTDRAFASVLAETTEKIKTETGGLFLGTLKGDTWYIIEAIDPGPNSIFSVAYFEYDQKYTQHLINKVANLYDEKLTLIGLWHRHPGSFDKFSSTDDKTNRKYASMRDEGALSALVNIDPSFRLTMYQVEKPCSYNKIPYEVGDHLIPQNLLKLKAPEAYFSLMSRLHFQPARNNQAGRRRKSLSLFSFMELIAPELRGSEYLDGGHGLPLADEGAKEKLLDEIVDDLIFMTDIAGVTTTVQFDDNHLTAGQDTDDKPAHLQFMVSSPDHKLILSYGDKAYTYRRGLLTEAFGRVTATRNEMNSSLLNAGEKGSD